MLPLMARILMRSDVPPWPAIESAFLHMRDVVGDKVIAQRVAFVHRAPQLASLRIYKNAAAGVANAIGINAQHARLGIARENVGAVFFPRAGIRIVDVRSRAYPHEQLLSIR